jgi:hypothetical protein
MYIGTFHLRVRNQSILDAASLISRPIAKAFNLTETVASPIAEAFGLSESKAQPEPGDPKPKKSKRKRADAE